MQGDATSNRLFGPKEIGNSSSIIWTKSGSL